MALVLDIGIAKTFETTWLLTSPLGDGWARMAEEGED